MAPCPEVTGVTQICIERGAVGDANGGRSVFVPFKAERRLVHRCYLVSLGVVWTRPSFELKWGVEERPVF